VQFKLFNGDEITGTVSDFTPYTITVRPDQDNDEVVLRKLALVYYRHIGGGQTANGATPATQDRHEHDHPGEGDLGSDRPDEPDSPEVDNMDEDRGV
jgi:hypothetical protein